LLTEPDNDLCPALQESYPHARTPKVNANLRATRPTHATFLLYWRWRQHIAPKRRYVSTKTQNATSKTTLIGAQIKHLTLNTFYFLG